MKQTKNRYYFAGQQLKKKYLRKSIILSYLSSTFKIITNLILFSSIIYFTIMMKGYTINEMSYRTIKLGRSVFIYPLILFIILFSVNLITSFININFRKIDKVKFYSNLFSDIKALRKKHLTKLIINTLLFIFTLIMFCFWFRQINNVGFNAVMFDEPFEHQQPVIRAFTKFVVGLMITILILEFILITLYTVFYIISMRTIKKYEIISKYAIEGIIEGGIANE